jgi:hypothetical protein
VKSANGLKLTEGLRIEVENPLNFCHPCILSSIAFIIGGESTISEELENFSILRGRQIVMRSYFNESSVADIDSESQSSCWNCLESSVLSQSWIDSRSLEFEDKLFFDGDHRIQITDFYPTDLRFWTTGSDADVLSECFKGILIV